MKSLSLAVKLSVIRCENTVQCLKMLDFLNRLIVQSSLKNKDKIKERGKMATC